tara:strand:+ start:476 stop:994 length:519 start_codon:yes stop_codon:yes gene_type:complete
MSGIVNNTGAISGVIGTTVGAAAGHVVTMSTLVNHTGTASSVFDNDANTNGFESGLECTLDVTSTTNKIFIIACFMWGTDSDNSCDIRMFATKSGQTDVMLSHGYAHTEGYYKSTSIGMSGVHSPAVTGEWVYKIYGQSAGDMIMNGKHNTGGAVGAISSPSSCIIAYEVKQ